VIRAVTIDFWNTLFDTSNGEARKRCRDDALSGALQSVGFEWDTDRAELHVFDGLRYISHYAVRTGGGFKADKVVVGNHAFTGYNPLSGNIRVSDITLRFT